ncbi:Coatomer, beta' subunit, partial [Caulochytrium protostelioides]
PLRLDVKRKLSNRSDRVKAMDFHPTEPWVLSALYNGTVFIWNHETQALVKTFEVTDKPIRSAKFVARKSWIVVGSDDMQIRVFNYNTHERVAAFDAHSDYIRGLAIHPTQPLVLSCSDDYTIKLWDWEKNWRAVQVFEGHTHYIMQVVFNPKDPNTFASASLDQMVRVWSLGWPTPMFTLEGHTKGVNALDYYHGSDKPYLVSAADDKTVKVWDYQNKTCVQTLQGHSQNVTVVCYHPELPVIISGGEDGTVRIWHANTYRLENTLNYGLERVWAMAYMKGGNDVAFGFDEGTIVVKLGREEPAISMDNSGKIIWAKHNEIQTANVKTAITTDGAADEADDDQPTLHLTPKDLGNCDIYPQTLQHSPNGRFVVVCGDGEYIIYTALAWRNKSFGQALDFCWALDSNAYAIRESSNSVKLFKNFKEVRQMRAPFAEGIFGGTLLGVRGANFMNFYDWETGACLRRIDVTARQVYWAESDLVAIVTDDACFVLRFNRIAYQQVAERGGLAQIGEDGDASFFDCIAQVNETIRSGCWVGDCFIYTNGAHRLNYLVGTQTATLAHFDEGMYLLGYLSRDHRVYLVDKDFRVKGFSFPLSLIAYQTAVLRHDMAQAQQVLPTIPRALLGKVARFLEGQGHQAEALAVAVDPDHRFELAIGLGELQVASAIAEAMPPPQTEMWRQIGDAALKAWDYGLALRAYEQAEDLHALFLIYKAGGQRSGMMRLAEKAHARGLFNLAFLCNHLTGRTAENLAMLMENKRWSEAALFARTYLPSRIADVVAGWRAYL